MDDETRAPETRERPVPDGDDASEDSTSSNFHLYRWGCPYCEKSNLQMAASSNGKQRVMAAVARHIRLADGDGHGPKHALPNDSVDIQAAITENITSLDGDE